MVQYYLYCDPATSNPLLSDVQRAFHSLNATASPLFSLVSFLQQNSSASHALAPILPPALSLQVNVSLTLAEVNATMYGPLDCTRLHGDLVQAVELLCDPALSSFYSVMWGKLTSPACVLWEGEGVDTPFTYGGPLFIPPFLLCSATDQCDFFDAHALFPAVASHASVAPRANDVH